MARMVGLGCRSRSSRRDLVVQQQRHNTIPASAKFNGVDDQRRQKLFRTPINLNDSSKAARHHPLNRGCEKTRVMVGSWRMKAHNWQPSGESRLASLQSN